MCIFTKKYPDQRLHMCTIWMARTFFKSYLIIFKGRPFPKVFVLLSWHFDKTTCFWNTRRKLIFILTDASYLQRHFAFMYTRYPDLWTIQSRMIRHCYFHGAHMAVFSGTLRQSVLPCRNLWCNREKCGCTRFVKSAPFAKL